MYELTSRYSVGTNSWRSDVTAQFLDAVPVSDSTFSVPLNRTAPAVSLRLVYRQNVVVRKPVRNVGR